MHDIRTGQYLGLRVMPLRTDSIVPRPQKLGDAGIDLHAYEDTRLEQGKVSRITTGIAVEIPAGCVGLVCPRSGLASAYGITVANAPGIIDCNFRGEIEVMLTKPTPGPYSIARGDRIAQLVIVPYHTYRI